MILRFFIRRNFAHQYIHSRAVSCIIKIQRGIYKCKIFRSFFTMSYGSLKALNISS